MKYLKDHLGGIVVVNLVGDAATFRGRLAELGADHVSLDHAETADGTKADGRLVVPVASILFVQVL